MKCKAGETRVGGRCVKNVPNYRNYSGEALAEVHAGVNRIFEKYDEGEMPDYEAWKRVEKIFKSSSRKFGKKPGRMKKVGIKYATSNNTGGNVYVDEIALSNGLFVEVSDNILALQKHDIDNASENIYVGLKWGKEKYKPKKNFTYVKDYKMVGNNLHVYTVYGDHVVVKPKYSEDSVKNLTTGEKSGELYQWG